MARNFTVRIILQIATAETYCAREVLNILKGAEWSAFNGEKFCVFLPINDNGAFDWREEKLSENALADLLGRKEHLSQINGFRLFHEDGCTAVTVMICSDREIVFDLNFPRKEIVTESGAEMTDINWYRQKLVLPFEKSGYDILEIMYDEF